MFLNKQIPVIAKGVYCFAESFSVRLNHHVADKRKILYDAVQVTGNRRTRKEKVPGNIFSFIIVLEFIIIAAVGIIRVIVDTLYASALAVISITPLVSALGICGVYISLFHKASGLVVLILIVSGVSADVPLFHRAAKAFLFTVRAIPEIGVVPGFRVKIRFLRTGSSGIFRVVGFPSWGLALGVILIINGLLSRGAGPDGQCRQKDNRLFHIEIQGVIYVSESRGPPW